MTTQTANHVANYNDAQSLPRWFTILTWMLVVSNLFIFGILTLVNPLGTFAQSDASAIFPIQFFAVRHIAMAIPLAHGLVTRNTTVLRTMYTMFVIISVLDISLLLINGYYIPFIGDLPLLATGVLALVMFFIPMALGLNYLRSANV